MKRIVLFTLLLFISIQSVCFAIGAPDYLPNGPHPRIWLTSTELAKLNAKQAANNADWVALEAWCDANINTPGYDAGDAGWHGGYRFSQYYDFLNSFALGYQVLKDDNPTKALTYAVYARKLLVDGILRSFSTGEELNGLKAIRLGEATDRTINNAESTALGIDYGTYKNGYAARNLASAVVTFDWLVESGVFSAADKTNLSSMFFRWYDWIRGVRSTHNNGVLVSGVRYYEDVDGVCDGITNVCTTNAATLGYSYGSIDGNFMGGYAYLMSLIPIATYGENADAATYLTAFEKMLANDIIAPLSDPLIQKGGESGEGWSYGSSFHNLTMGLYGYYTGTGKNIYSTFAWPEDVVKAMIHRSASNMKDVPIFGVWKGVPLENRRYMMLPNIGVLQRIKPSSIYTEVGQYWLNSGVISDTHRIYENLLWYQPGYPATSPTNAGLPLSNVAEGHGFVTSRSSWANAADSIHFSIRLEGKMSAGYDAYDEGSFYLQRGDDKLVTRSPLSQASVMSSSLVFNNASHHANNPPLTKPAIDKFEDTGDYMYVSGDITNAWDRKYKTSNAKLVRKSAIHLRPGLFVIYDVAQSNSAVSNLKEWYIQYGKEPIISGNIVAVTNGNSKVFVKNLFPQGGTFTKSTPLTGYWSAKYTPLLSQEFDQFLHVIETTNSTQSTMTNATQIVSTQGNMRGAYINDTLNNHNNWVVLFTSAQTGAAVENNVTFELDSTSMIFNPKIVLADLIPGTDYTFFPPANRNSTLQTFSFVRGVVAGKEKQVYRSSDQGIIYVKPIEGPGKLRL